MVHCPVFLKDRCGISFIELLIVLAFIGAMAVFLLVALNPTVQMAKARDGRRKADLQKLKNSLEDYYNDHNCYPPSELMTCNPGTGLQPYWSKIPCDPLTGSSYYYERPDCNKYRIYVKLEYAKDPAIASVGCQSGCGPGGSTAYNFGVTSANTRLESGAAGGVEECSGDWWACQLGGECNNYGPVKPNCPLGGQAYCNDSGCGEGCGSQLPCQ